MIATHIEELFMFYKRLIIFKDIFDPKQDEYAINQLALSATAVELDLQKADIQKVLNLD